MNKDTYKSAVDSVAFSKELETETLNYLAANPLQNKKEVTSMKSKQVMKGLGAALVVILAVLILLPILGGSDFELVNSDKVSVKYVKEAPEGIISSDSFAPLTEDELFNKYNTNIFKGTVEEVKNVEIDFNGSAEYRAIAKIKIEKIYRGDASAGEVVSVLLPGPVNSEVQAADNEVISTIKEGTTGIFMPVEYEGTSYREENGAKIYWEEIAEYGILDGVRYAFLESENGIVFDHESYKTIADAASLDEVEAYIVNKLYKK